MGDTPVTFRHGRADDAERLLEFAARTYYETFASVNTPENMQAYMELAFTLPQIKTELSDSRSFFVLAESAGNLIGYAKFLSGEAPNCVVGEAPVELVRFYIDHPWHGTGLAASLMEHCLSEVKQRGFKTIFLGVWEKNLRAQAFYRKWDFERVGEHIFYMGDDPQTDWWLMRRI